MNTLTYDNLQRVTRLEQADQSGGNVVADKRIDFAYDAGGAFTKITRYADLDDQRARRHQPLRLRRHGPFGAADALDQHDRPRFRLRQQMPWPATPSPTTPPAGSPRSIPTSMA